MYRVVRGGGGRSALRVCPCVHFFEQQLRASRAQGFQKQHLQHHTRQLSTTRGLWTGSQLSVLSGAARRGEGGGGAIGGDFEVAARRCRGVGYHHGHRQQQQRDFTHTPAAQAAASYDDLDHHYDEESRGFEFPEPKAASQRRKRKKRRRPPGRGAGTGREAGPLPLAVKHAVKTNLPRGFVRRDEGNEKLRSWHVPILRPQFRVAIVGRPNAGKSTLFNRLSRHSPGGGRRTEAIVTPIAGTTRDINERPVHFGGMDITLVDTGGLEDDADDIKARAYGDMGSRILSKTEMALRVADVVLYVVDARSGITEADQHFAKWVRRGQAESRAGRASSVDDDEDDDGMGMKRREQSILLVANKAEGGVATNLYLEDCLAECTRLGFGEAVPISAQHGDGMGLLAAALIPPYEEYEAALQAFDEQQLVIQQQKQHQREREGLEGQEEVEEEEEVDENDPARWGDAVQLAIVGRPNVGKSSLLNAIINEDRALVGATPGLTRDSVIVDWQWDGRHMRLVDTAGIRASSSRKKTDDALEKASVEASIRAISRAQVVVLVLDGAEGMFRKTELTIASQVAKEGRALVVCANKADLVGVGLKEYAVGVGRQIEKVLPDVSFPPVVALSAIRNPNVPDLMATVVDAHDRWRRRVSTAELNKWLKQLERLKMPPRHPGTKRQIRLKYMTQIKSGPPSFALFSNTTELPDSYQRFLMKKLQEEFGFYGMSPRLVVRQPANLYHDKTKRVPKGASLRRLAKAPSRRTVREGRRESKSERLGPGAVKNRTKAGRAAKSSASASY